MRAVHAIRFSQKNRVPIAFIQWGNSENGFKYEVVCPFCSKTVGWVDDTDPPDALTQDQIDTACKIEMREHISFCPYPGQRLMVYITEVPLGTDDKEPPRVM